MDEIARRVVRGGGKTGDISITKYKSAIRWERGTLLRRGLNICHTGGGGKGREQLFFAGIEYK